MGLSLYRASGLIYLLSAPERSNQAERMVKFSRNDGCWSHGEQSDPAPVISTVLFGRFQSQGEADHANRILSAMRMQFGGHDEKQKGGA